MKKREEILEIIQSVLSKADYMNLIATGSPKNEYNIEAEMIADLLIKSNPMICTSKMLHDVFTEEFEDVFTIEEFDCISEEINKKLML